MEFVRGGTQYWERASSPQAVESTWRDQVLIPRQVGRAVFWPFGLRQMVFSTVSLGD